MKQSVERCSVSTLTSASFRAAPAPALHAGLALGYGDVLRRAMGRLRPNVSADQVGTGRWPRWRTSAHLQRGHGAQTGESKAIRASVDPDLVQSSRS
jgi:hypothetical protein